MNDNNTITIRREFVELTGSPFKAMVLERVIFWTQHHLLWDKSYQGHRTRRKTCGWFRKSTKELCDEMFGMIGQRKCREILKELATQGLIQEKTINQRVILYRANLAELHKKLPHLFNETPNTNQTPTHQPTHNPVENYVDNPVDKPTKQSAIKQTTPQSCVLTAQKFGFNGTNSPPFPPLTIPLYPHNNKTIPFGIGSNANRRVGDVILSSRQLENRRRFAKELDFLEIFDSICLKMTNRHSRLSGLGKNGLPHPKVLKAGERFKNAGVSVDLFETAVVQAFRSERPPEDLAQMWCWWKRWIARRVSLKASETHRPTYRAPQTGGLVNIGQAISQVFGGVSRISL